MMGIYPVGATARYIRGESPRLTAAYSRCTCVFSMAFSA